MNRIALRCRGAVRFALGALLSAVASASAPVADGSRGPADADELRGFFDALFRDQMAEHAIPGLAAVVVKDGRTWLSAGYGFADVARRRPVVPAETLFPMGSISKLLTTIAVLQQAEQGRLDLQADVAGYVPAVRIDRRFGQPVTLHQVLTHTDGFDVRWLFGGAAASAAELKPLELVLADLPPRVFPPGELYVYSDVGLTLAGYVVEQVAESPFAEYMERRVIEPLGMRRSTFRRPLPPALREAVATGYEDTYRGDGTNRALPPAYHLSAPAAGLTGTVEDLGRLLAALLNRDELAGAGILTPASARGLFARQFSHHDGLPGVTYGLYEYERNGERGLMHGGLMLGYTSVVFLLPEHRLGLAVAANKYGLVSLLEEQLLQRFLDRYYPAPPAAARPAPPAEPAALSSRLAGTYRCDQYSRRSLDKLALASGLANEITVRPEPDGALRFLPEDTRWRPVGPLLYENEQSGQRVAFRRSSDGRGERIVGSAQFMSYHRLGWFDRLTTQAALAQGFVGVALAGAAATGGLSLWGRWRAPGRSSRRILAARTLTGLTALLLVGFLVSLVTGIASLDVATAFLGLPARLRAALWLPLLFTLTGAGALAAALAAGKARWPVRSERLVHLVVGAAALLFIPVLRFWNLFPLPGSF